MPIKQRHTVISLGEIAAGEYSDEIDASSFNEAILYVENTSGLNAKFTIEANPAESGEAGEWYRFGTTGIPTQVKAGELLAFPIPLYAYSEYGCARRMRIEVKDTTATLWVELIREIG